MLRPEPHDRQRATQAADLLMSDPGSDLWAALSLLGLLSTPAPASAVMPYPRRPDDDLLPGLLGLWTPIWEDSRITFKRQSDHPLEWCWAAQDRIELVKRQPRIVLLGESMARGVYFDPQFGPARALQTMIGWATDNVCEVVDLSSLWMSPAQIVKLAESALILKPDAFVVMAGAQFLHHLAPADADASWMYGLGRSLRQADPLHATRAQVEEWLVALTARFVQSLDTLHQRSGIPIVLVVPEFNLRDWRDDVLHQTPLLQGDALAEWLACRDDVWGAVREGQHAKAGQAAERMMALDGGTSAWSLHLLADAKLRQNLRLEARRLHEQLRDLVLARPGWALPLVSPRGSTCVQQALRERAAACHGLSVVDLPQRCIEYLDGDLPGRQLFMDGRHMTVQGTKLAMASVAEKLLPALGEPSRRWRDLIHADLPLGRDIVARGHLLAAIANASAGQPLELIVHHAAQALCASRDSAGRMTALLDALTHDTPALSSFTTLFVRPGAWPKILPLILGDPRAAGVAPLRLVDALTRALEKADPDRAGGGEAFVSARTAAPGSSIDLLASTLTGSSDRHPSVAARARHAGYRAYDHRSRFRFALAEPAAVDLVLTCRARHALATGAEMLIDVNGERLAAWPVSGSWRTWRCRIDAARLLDGVNLIVVEWPVPAWQAADLVDRAARRIERALDPDLAPVHGEICRFAVSVSG